MGTWIEAPDVSTAWLAGAERLLLAGGHESNLAVRILEPLREREAIRRLVEEFGARRRRGRGTWMEIRTVAETIFPSSFYRRAASNPERHLYELERRTRRVVRRHPANRRGTYFQRLVAYPGENGEEVNQLETVVAKLRRAAELGRRNGNAYELVIFHPQRDRNPIGFPCLSYVSVTLNEGRLDATAMYRNQYLLERAYGNYIGLGRLQHFLASESGFEVGELMCVASHVRLEIERYGQRRIASLIADCRRTLEEEVV